MGFEILNDVGGVKNKEKVSRNELEKIKNHCIICEKL